MVIAALARRFPTASQRRREARRCNFLFGGIHPKTGEYYANYHLEGGGWGATSYGDGNDAIIVKNGNCRNTPVEIFETRYPLRTLEYSLIPDSGGAGDDARRARHEPDRTRHARAPRSPPTPCSTGRSPASARGASRAAGSAGRERSGSSAAATPSSARSRRSSAPRSPSKFTNVTLEPGDEVLIDSPGGGGYGDPGDRDRALVERDVHQGFVVGGAGTRALRPARGGERLMMRSIYDVVGDVDLS